MSREYTEIIEGSYPGFMKDQWIMYKEHLERKVRKAKVKIAELEKKEDQQLAEVFSKVGADEVSK